MFDAALRPFVDRALDPIGRRLADSGIGANHVTLAGFALGAAGGVCIAMGGGAWALALFAANRVCDGLDGAVARARGATDLGGFLDITLDFIVYSGLVFAFAIADPRNATAAAFLIFSFIGTGTSFLAFAIVAQKRDISTEVRGKKSFFYLGGLTEGFETIIFLSIVIAIPVLFTPLAWIFGGLCWITTGTRIAFAVRQLAGPKGRDTGDRR